MPVPDLVARIAAYGVLIEIRADKRQKVEPEILGAVICSELPPAPKTPSDLPQLPGQCTISEGNLWAWVTINSFRIWDAACIVYQ